MTYMPFITKCTANAAGKCRIVIELKTRAEQAEIENARLHAELDAACRDLAFYLDGIGKEYCRPSVAAVIKQIVAGVGAGEGQP